MMPGTCAEHGTWGGTQKRCPPCRKRVRAAWYQAHQEVELARSIRDYQAAKAKVYDHYGEKCACCGETEPAFLCLDHVNDDGYAWRKALFNGKNVGSGAKVYREIIRQGFPESFQVLCQNCNWGKRQPDGCPHQGRP